MNAATTFESFRHTHWSGRFTATGEEEEALLDRLMRTADLVTTTEVNNPIRSHALREVGWGAVFGNKGPRDDCGIAFRKSRFLLREGGTRTLSRLRYMTERHTLSDTTEGAYAVLNDKVTGKTGVVVVVHMPHGMQADLQKGNYDSDVARAYRDILKGARRLANGLLATYHADWAMIVGDWNLNLKHLWVAAYFAVRFPQYLVNFSKPYPTRGTFGPLLMDLALLRGIAPLEPPHILKAANGFDHVGWTQVL